MVKKKLTFSLLLIVLIGLAGCEEADVSEQKFEEPVSVYQLLAADVHRHRTVLKINTQTGETWFLSMPPFRWVPLEGQKTNEELCQGLGYAGYDSGRLGCQ